jgi:GTP-binding protein Era
MGDRLLITSAKRQTTRQQFRCILTTDAYQIIFVDTPGLHEPKNKLGEFMLRESLNSVANSDIVLYILDAANPDDELPVDFPRGKPVILVLNKADLLLPNRVEELKERFQAQGRFSRVLAISAFNRTNLDALLQAIVDCLPEGEMLYPPDQLMDCDYRLLAAELIREQALLHLEEEVPHGIAVELVAFSESDDEATIQANIIVERESHKGIVIGRNGSKLKTIGTGARLEIQDLMDKKVHLKLWVKVRKNWRKDPAQLKGLGYR